MEKIYITQVVNLRTALFSKDLLLIQVYLSISQYEDKAVEDSIRKLLIYWEKMIKITVKLNGELECYGREMKRRHL